MKNTIQIEIAKPQDAKELLALYAPYVEQTAVSFEYTVPTEEEFAQRIQKTLERYPYLVARRDGEILGYAYVSPFKARPAYDWSVETSIYIRRDAKKMGVGRMLYEKLEEVLGRMGVLNMNACIAYPTKEDEYLTMDSIHFHEKMGYRMVGRFHNSGYKFDRWYDMVWMEKLIGEHTSPQGNVVKFNEKLFK